VILVAVSIVPFFFYSVDFSAFAGFEM